MLGQQRDLQPGDSIATSDLERLLQQAKEAATCSSDAPLLYLADACKRAASRLPGICVLPDLLTALAVGVSDAASVMQQQSDNAQAPSDPELRQTFRGLLLSCTAPEGLQQPPLAVVSTAELATLIYGYVRSTKWWMSITAPLPAGQAIL